MSRRQIVAIALLTAAAFAPVTGASASLVADESAAEVTVLTDDTPSKSEVAGVVPDTRTSWSASSQQVSSERNNSTAPRRNDSAVPHRNPRAVSEESDLGEVQTWLVREMSGELSRSANESEENRERARRLVDNDSEYARLADQYAELTNGTPGENAEDSRFSTVGLLQREFFAELESYRETYRTYRQARDLNATRTNSTVRTRRLAHRLERRAESVNRTAIRLNRSYANLSSARQGRFRHVTRTIGRLRANVTDAQMTVRNQTLVRTDLSIRTEESTVSFANPATLVGRLRTANGTPVADRNVTLRIGNRTLDATTDASGRFSLAYRPTLASVGERRRSVAFRPDNESMYVGANASVRLAVQRVTPTVGLSTSPGRVSYDEALTVEGRVGTDGVGAPAVPLVVTVGGVRVALLQTGPDGSFEASRRLPANVSTGDRQVRVRLGPDAVSRDGGGRGSLAPANATVPIRVESTPTSLSITEARTLDESAFVAGRLVAGSDRPVPNRTVSVVVGGTTITTARTNATGAFAATVELPERARSGGAGRVVVRYSEIGNLESARANDTLSSVGSGPVLSDDLPLGVAGLVFLTVFGVVVWRLRSEDPHGFAEETRESDGDAEIARHSSEKLFDSAVSSLDAGAFDAVVVLTYAAVRSEFGEEVHSQGPQTHLEFAAVCRDADLLGDADLETLARLTELYECAAFASGSVSEAEAREALELAESLQGMAGEPPVGPEPTAA
ncbi:hypothetical protein [Halorussus lipolyticus]|uniref:hypothetical protein n=1 Tax=Halorussus lipolyticus TaxID=3034024 RepID=UPI0023E7AC62|nr:hypothetical protein [Halorussus sp. DT80]